MNDVAASPERGPRTSVLPVWSLGALAGLAYLLAVLPLANFDRVPENPDTPSHMALARKHGPTELATFSNGLYPGGYVAFLGFAARHLGMHPVIAGKALSLASGFACALLVFLIGSRVHSGLAGASGVFILLLNRTFLVHSSMEGTDVPAVALTMVAVFFMMSHDGRPDDTRHSFAAGIALGAAYLVRFTTLPLLPIFAVSAASATPRGKSVGALVLGFTAAAAPQLVASWVVHGNPFYNEQIKNVWFGLHGGRDWARTWRSIPPPEAIWAELRGHPWLLLRHWGEEFTGYFAHSTGWRWWVSLPAMMSLPYLVLTRSLSLRRRLFLIAVPLCSVASAALAFLTDRHGLIAVVSMSLAAGIMVRDVQIWSIRRVPLRGFAFAGSLILGMLAVTLLAVSSPPRPGDGDASRLDALTHDLGLTDPVTVATNLPLVDIDDRFLTPYSRFFSPVATCIDSLLRSCEDNDDIQMVVLDYHSHWGDFLGVRHEANAGGSPLVPVYREDSLDVYMVRPGGIGDALADSVEFTPGLLLLGHTWVWRNEKLVVYLYWAVTEPLEERYTVEVRLLDDKGGVLVSNASEPELGTYPTTRWELGKIAVDARILEVPQGANRGEAEVCFTNLADSSRSCHRLWTVHKGGRTPLP